MARADISGAIPARNQASPLDSARGAALYSARTLAMYDWWVHGLSNRLAWRCPTSSLLALYRQHASGRHLDVGVGTGFLIERTSFPAPGSIALLDLNRESLRYAAARLARRRPTCHMADVLSPNAVEHLQDTPFDSIAIMYLLHCLPGTLEDKSIVFGNLGRLLSRQGVLFGATILGAGAEGTKEVRHNLPARVLMRLYNSRGIFNNEQDTLDRLRRALEHHFDQSRITVRGCVALFEARGYRSPEKQSRACR